MSEKYILDPQGVPILCEDIMEWGRWFESNDNRKVAQTNIGDARVSTVFLGLDHRFGGHGLPILWETMIFGGPHDQYQRRYTSREAAEDDHRRIVEALRQGHEP